MPSLKIEPRVVRLLHVARQGLPGPPGPAGPPISDENILYLTGRAPVFAQHGTQLTALGRAIVDALVQDLVIVFIGDSITWGSGAEGQEDPGTRDKTLSDPRNNSTCASYVNEFGRWLLARMGNGATESFANHPASPSGESIRIIHKTIDLYPWQKMFQRQPIGSATFSDVADPQALCNQRLVVSMAVNASADLSFTMSGTGFTLFFGVTGSGALYNVLVNGVEIATDQSTRTGDDGLTYGYSRSRSYSFDKVLNATVVIRSHHYNDISGTTSNLIEAIRIDKTITISNQGIIGATGKTYFTYNFPTTATTFTYLIPPDIAGFSAVPTNGSGTTSSSVGAAAASLTGWQYRYNVTLGAIWALTFPVDPLKGYIDIGYSSVVGGADVDVVVDGVTVDTFATSSIAPGGVYGYAKTHQVHLPDGTTSVSLVVRYATYNDPPDPVVGLYLEGIANHDGAIHYPTDNSFNDGVALSDLTDFCFIQLGTNDRAAGDSNVESVTTIRHWLEKMLEIKPVNTRPILMVAQPAIDDTLPGYALGMEDQARIISSLAFDEQIDFINNMAPFEGIDKASYINDDPHPNDPGHALIAHNIIHAIQSAGSAGTGQDLSVYALKQSGTIRGQYDEFETYVPTNGATVTHEYSKGAAKIDASSLGAGSSFTITITDWPGGAVFAALEILLICGANVPTVSWTNKGANVTAPTLTASRKNMIIPSSWDQGATVNLSDGGNF